jgi:hypothetical protein
MRAPRIKPFLKEYAGVAAEKWAATPAYSTLF